MKHLQISFCMILTPSINSASYTYFVIRRVIILKLIKLMTHLEAHLKNYSLLKKKRCHEVINKVIFFYFNFYDEEIVRHCTYTNDELN